MEGYTFVKLREARDMVENAARWFHSKWGVPLDAYRESIAECISGGKAVPQWYLVTCGEKICAGCGVIENDFHDRKDLAPNLCALYVEKEHRGKGLARLILDYVRRDMAALGTERLYLITDHTDFYEKCGWEYLTTVNDDGGTVSRMYTAKTTDIAE